ncbi:trypsin-like peptidase domain-containing protein [Streptomyces sp. CA-111067]|uniref:VMAP-C domain-containing protein n=1 Tax=Streptomyces sp. CA-111067 TaxID=3240046 RepID=UPI003D991C5B
MIADPDAPVRRAWVSVAAAGAPHPVGAGVVIADGHVLTCAHVLNAALGRDKMAAAAPTSDDLAAVSLTLPDCGPQPYRPELACWLPPSANPGQGHGWDGDLALLRLPAQAPAVTPVRLADAELNSTLWAWYADGDGRSAVDVVVQKVIGPWLLLDPRNAWLAVGPGYSGGPLWSSATRSLAGIVVSVEPDVRRYYAIGPAAVRQLLVRAGLPLPAGRGEAPRDPRRARLHRQLTETLDALPQDRYTAGLARLLRMLRLPPGPYDPEEAASAALADPRGLPALRDAFRDAFRDAEERGPTAASARLADLAARACPLRLLAPADHAELCGMLSVLPMSRLLAAARAAVPYLPLRADRLPDAAAFIDCLENRQSEPGVMPPLLQVVEEIAVQRPDDGDELREWSTRVADRLRVRGGALDQVRALARARARAGAGAGDQGAGRPVVRVWLRDCGRPDAYTYDIRLYDGDDRPVECWTAVDEPRGHEQLCRELADAVAMLADHGENAGVEFLLEDGSFGLPIDRWQIPTRLLGPRPLGVDRFVVLRGQEPPARGWWERRWGCRGAAASVLDDVDSADDLLGTDLDAAFVIAACPPDDIDAMVRVCRHYGVPVVLWQRKRVAAEDAGALLELAADDAGTLLELAGEDWPSTLREGVRRHRVKARADEQHLGAHLALLWEDPRWDPRRARLTEPTSKGGAA